MPRRGYYVAGKTGTAQKFMNGAYSKSKYIANFVGFVPASNPRFVLLVSADEPQGGYYGGKVAGPAFREIAERTLKYMNVKPDYDADAREKEEKLAARQRWLQKQKELKEKENRPVARPRNVQPARRTPVVTPRRNGSQPKYRYITISRVDNRRSSGR